MNSEWASSSICERMKVRATWPGTIQLVWRLTARWRMDHFDLVAKWLTRPENENPFWVMMEPRSTDHLKTEQLCYLWLSSTHQDKLSTWNSSIFFSVCFNWISRASSENLPSKPTAHGLRNQFADCIGIAYSRLAPVHLVRFAAHLYHETISHSLSNGSRKMSHSCVGKSDLYVTGQRLCRHSLSSVFIVFMLGVTDIRLLVICFYIGCTFCFDNTSVWWTAKNANSGRRRNNFHIW